MNDSLEKLYQIGKKNTRTIIGLMSGTSLDGLDVALCAVSGHGRATKISVKQFKTTEYDEDFRTEVKTIFSKPSVSLEKLCLLNEWIGVQHASMVNNCLTTWNVSHETIDLIASHGQTIYHAPVHQHQNSKFGHGTLQIGDADQIAVNTGIITISDFRQKHIAAGGEGAPLAAYGDYILFSEEEKDVIMLNIGGIANFTCMPASCAFEKIICSDIGPGNGLMDAWMQQNFPGKHYDEHGNLAKSGTVHEGLFNALKEADFFSRSFPKTTGPELFNLSYLANAMKRSDAENLQAADTMATLNQFTATIICEAIKNLITNSDYKLIISGGGLHNQQLISNIKNIIPGIMIESTLQKNMDPDSKEAALFSLLANECVSGNGYELGTGSSQLPAITMGKISFPK